VNVLGAFRVAQRFARGMAARRTGKIVQVGSVAGIKGAPQAAHYAASKAALGGMARSMALELAAQGVSVFTVHPGFIDTPMLGPHRDAIRVVTEWRTPLRRLGRPEEVAEAVWLLLAAEAPYLTGAELVVDGGLSLG
jgi:NAD(P)-dependent dehydrogenase (short-subunit alcohol dehydrogenase family)